MALIIVLSVGAALFAIGGYYLMVRKYYWGPGGPPKTEDEHAQREED
jgi:hypothetical protein